jgi:hypothetical protein
MLMLLAQTAAKGNQDGGSGFGIFIAIMFIVFCYVLIFGDKKKK